MTPDQTTACPVCGRRHRAHPNPAQRGEPHYCSIGCYRTGHDLDHPTRGDGRQWCQTCHRYTDHAGHDPECPTASTNQKETTAIFTPPSSGEFHRATLGNFSERRQCVCEQRPCANEIKGGIGGLRASRVQQPGDRSIGNQHVEGGEVPVAQHVRSSRGSCLNAAHVRCIQVVSYGPSLLWMHSSTQRSWSARTPPRPPPWKRRSHQFGLVLCQPERVLPTSRCCRSPFQPCLGCPGQRVAMTRAPKVERFGAGKQLARRNSAAAVISRSTQPSLGQGRHATGGTLRRRSGRCGRSHSRCPLLPRARQALPPTPGAGRRRAQRLGPDNLDLTFLHHLSMVTLQPIGVGKRSTQLVSGSALATTRRCAAWRRRRFSVDPSRPVGPRRLRLRCRGRRTGQLLAASSTGSDETISWPDLRAR